jgi:hypothetical protein
LQIKKKYDEWEVIFFMVEPEIIFEDPVTQYQFVRNVAATNNMVREFLSDLSYDDVSEIIDNSTILFDKKGRVLIIIHDEKVFDITLGK